MHNIVLIASHWPWGSSLTAITLLPFVLQNILFCPLKKKKYIMYLMCVCLFSALSRRVGALQISIIIIRASPSLEAFTVPFIIRVFLLSVCVFACPRCVTFPTSVCLCLIEISMG